MLNSTGKVLAAVVLIALPAALAQNVPASLQYSLRYLGPDKAFSRMTMDAAGNLFYLNSAPAGSAAPFRITKTDAAGNTLGTFDFGVSGPTAVHAFTADSAGNVLIAGSSTADDWPLVSPLQTTGGAFLMRIDNQLTKIIFSTRLGDTPSSAYAVAFDTDGNIYVTGTAGAALPVTPGVFQPAIPAGADVKTENGFVQKISADGSRIIFSTYYTGSESRPTFCLNGLPICIYPFTRPEEIAVDASGNMVIAGSTSDSVPVTPGAYMTIHPFSSNPVTFVAKIAPGGTKLIWGTLLPVSDISGIALDGSGNLVITGATTGTIPTTGNAIQASLPPAPKPSPEDADQAVSSGYAGYVMKLDAPAQRF
ncbi:MAG: SBBP repeat-containing protein [Terriglobia bacterium]